MKHLFECNYWFSHCLTQGTAFVIVTLPHRSHRQGGSITFGTEYMGCSGFCTFCKSFTILRGTDPGLALARMCKFLAKEARLGLTFSGGACWFPQLGRKSSWAALRRDSKIWNVTRAQRRHRLTRSYPLLTELENQRIPSKKSRTNVKTNSGFGLVLSLPVSHLLPQPHIVTKKRQDSRFCARWSAHCQIPQDMQSICFRGAFPPFCQYSRSWDKIAGCCTYTPSKSRCLGVKA